LQSDPHRICLASTSVVPELIVLPVAGAEVATPQEGPPVTAQGQVPPPEPRAVPVGSVAAIRHSYRQRGFPKVAAQLLSSAIRTSKRSVYKGRFEEFARWCGKRKVDPIRASVEQIGNFLSSRLKKGLSYSMACGYRTAISSYLDLVDGRRVGDHPALACLMRGVFNSRLPMRPLPLVWDLQAVLRGLKLPPFEPFLNTSLKWASRKTALLLALAGAVIWSY
jgi:hypothetical protein